MSQIHFEDDSDDDSIQESFDPNIQNPIYFYQTTLQNSSFLPSTLPPQLYQQESHSPSPKPEDEVTSAQNKIETHKKGGGYSSLCMIKCNCKDFSNYEIRNFIQDVICAEITDLTTCRDRGSNPIGYVFCKFARPVQIPQLFKLNGRRFKNHVLTVTAFTKMSQFKKQMQLISEMKLNSIVLPVQKKSPIVYFFGFNGGRSDLLQVLKTCIKEEPEIIEKVHKGIKYHTATYSSKGSSMKVANVFNGYSIFDTIIFTRILFPNAAERAFCVRKCDDRKWLYNEIKRFGSMANYKEKNDDTFILMESIDDATAACLYLNGFIHDEQEIRTYFVEYSYFIKHI